MVPYLVCKFAKSTLSNLVKESFGSTFPNIFHKRQIGYMLRYLNDLGAKTVLLEREYIDKDYLEDYSRYYVKCFGNGGHKCARLHFFSSEVDHRFLDRVIAGLATREDTESLQNNYLGFFVVKPLPKTFIGKTCLKIYPKVRERHGLKACLAKNYEVDLFGIKLAVDSIAFQEQDKVVAACATTSIWSSLHAIPWINLREIPACSEITIHAINHIDGSSNSFPNKELSNKQILRALDVEGLRYHTESLRGSTLDEFFESVKCHIDSRLPMILGVEVYEVSRKKDLRKLAGHAVTVLGYKDSEGNKSVYIHDDRLGPFAKATFVNLENFSFIEKDDKPTNAWGLTLQEKNDSGDWEDAHEVLVPDSLIIPTHRKVRLSSTLARNTCKRMLGEYNKFLSNLADTRGEKEVASHRNVRFSVKLDEISRIRQRVIGGNASDDDLVQKRVHFLTGSYARFHWVATFYYLEEPAFEILFDATGIPQGDVLSAIIYEKWKPAELILGPIKAQAESARGKIEGLNSNLFGSLLKFLNPCKQGLAEHLDMTYGALRAPLYLKPQEFSEGDVAGNTSAKCHYEPVEDDLDAYSAKIFGSDPRDKLIWAVAHDGGLLVGREIGDLGHPSLTGFKPARIAGEIEKVGGKWLISSKSGRYSKDYRDESLYLQNAVKKIRTIFPASQHDIEVRLQTQ